MAGLAAGVFFARKEKQIGRTLDRQHTISDPACIAFRSCMFPTAGTFRASDGSDDRKEVDVSNGGMVSIPLRALK